MRKCTACGREMTDAATFCVQCGAEAPPPAPPVAAVQRYCSACGGELAAGARFCPACGTGVGPTPALRTTQPAAPELLAEPHAPVGPNRAILIGAAVAVLLLGLLFWFNRYEWLGLERPADEGNISAVAGSEATMYVVANANLRDRATTQGSSVTGKLVRGTRVAGVLQLGEDGSSNWYKLADGNFVSAVNLSASEPPPLARTINKPWYASEPVPLLAKPQPGAAVLETAEPGKSYQLIGLTAGGFAEVTLGKGGVAYFDASGIDLAAASAAPIDIAFDPQRCGYGKEIEMLFRKLGQDAQARFQRAESRAYASEDERLNALERLESASSFLPLTRSYRGLGVGGLGAHYEASAIYFRDPPAKVIAVFATDFPVAADGSFSVASDVGSAIRPAQGEERKYGQTALSCGV
jgi:hypothetical protein